jgi:hypothetical protein
MAIIHGNGKNLKCKVGALMLTSAILALGVGGASSTASAQDEATAEHERSGLSAPIEGTSILTIHRVNQGIDFSAFQSFTAGGVTVATGTTDRTPPPPISPLYGSWRRTCDIHGDNCAEATLGAITITGKRLIAEGASN